MESLLVACVTTVNGVVVVVIAFVVDVVVVVIDSVCAKVLERLCDSDLFALANSPLPLLLSLLPIESIIKLPVTGPVTPGPFVRGEKPLIVAVIRAVGEDVNKSSSGPGAGRSPCP